MPVKQVRIRREEETEQATEGIACRNCGKPNRPGRRYCDDCGGNLRPPKPRAEIVGEWDDEVSEGERPEAVSEYLHRQGYMVGPQLSTSLTHIQDRREAKWRAGCIHVWHTELRSLGRDRMEGQIVCCVHCGKPAPRRMQPVKDVSRERLSAAFTESQRAAGVLTPDDEHMVWTRLMLTAGAEIPQTLRSQIAQEWRIMPPDERVSCEGGFGVYARRRALAEAAKIMDERRKKVAKRTRRAKRP